MFIGFGDTAVDLDGPAAVGDNPGMRCVLVQGAAIADDRFRANAILCRARDDDACSQAKCLHRSTQSWNRLNGSFHERYARLSRSNPGRIMEAGP